MLTNKIITSYQVTVADVKKQLNIDASFTEDDSYIESLIETAEDFISGEISADVEVTTNTLTLKEVSGSVHIYEAPLISVESVKLDGVETTDFTVNPFWSHFEITLPDGEYEAVEVVFKTGYLKLPAGLKQAVIIKAANLYDPERSDLIVGVSVSKTGVIDSLISKYKRRYW
ncbi:head-tail connector protein [Marinilabilia salmonicolor]|uniref:head-tail connector protein n=1 Tax=Marinilabilia salmonicolor TaxID=989 RepID=UPI000299E1E8|nr:head-tail connector protein [Marinilabilia salmonicolor]